MKKVIGGLVAGVLVVALGIAADAKKGAVIVDPATAEFKPVIPGVTKHAIVGDATKGAYRALTKFDAGATNKLHSHPSDMWIVVVKGAYLYTPEGGTEKRIGPGQYLFVPGGDRHTSGSDAKEGVVFYEESSGAFGMTMVEEPAKK